MRSMITQLRGFTAAVAAGALGGALLSVGESMLLIRTPAAPEDIGSSCSGRATTDGTVRERLRTEMLAQLEQLRAGLRIGTIGSPNGAADLPL